jgi:hypothetical protein
VGPPLGSMGCRGCPVGRSYKISLGRFGSDADRDLDDRAYRPASVRRGIELVLSLRGFDSPETAKEMCRPGR